MRTHTYSYIHMHAHTYTYIHMHTHTYTYIHIDMDMQRSLNQKRTAKALKSGSHTYDLHWHVKPLESAVNTCDLGAVRISDIEGFAACQTFNQRRNAIQRTVCIQDWGFTMWLSCVVREPHTGRARSLQMMHKSKSQDVLPISHGFVSCFLFPWYLFLDLRKNSRHAPVKTHSRVFPCEQIFAR